MIPTFIVLTLMACVEPPPAPAPPIEPAPVAASAPVEAEPPRVLPEVVAGPGIPELGEPPAREPLRRAPPPPPPPPPPPGNPRPFPCGHTGGLCDARTQFCLHSGVIGGVHPPPGEDYNPTTWACSTLPSGCADCACLMRKTPSMGNLGCAGEAWTGLAVDNIGYAP